ncbi:CsbD family protein [Candidatus Nephthysia bennettiae]|uniref:CsbD family protein n=1 Tax=Candidatus Nephthysia bennettiae TaxID=3127016 RepID=UPI0030C7792D
MKDKIQGKAEELKGRVTGDRAAELKGKARQAVGEAKRLARDLGVEPRAPREGPPESRGEVERASETGAPEPAPPGPTRPTDP